MPKFIYTITIIIILNIFGIYFILTQLSPESDLNKVFFSILISFTLGVLIPLIDTLIKYLLKSKEDLNQYFKKSFKKYLIFAIFIGIMIFIKIKLSLDSKVLFILILACFFALYVYPNLRKPIKKTKY
jgi:hypothetical protein